MLKINKDKVIEELERENDELRRLLEEWKLEKKVWSQTTIAKNGL